MPQDHGYSTKGIISKTGRTIAFGMGVLFIGSAVAIALLVPISNLPAMFAAAGIFAAGADSLLAAIHARQPIIARIGPLP